MPRGKGKSRGGKSTPHTQKMLYKNEDQEYALVTKVLGGGNFRVRCNLSDEECIGRICGSLRHGSKRYHNNVSVGKLVLVGQRDFQRSGTAWVDILYVYSDQNAKKLIASGDFINLEETEKDHDTNCVYEFNELVDEEPKDEPEINFDEL